MVVSVKGAYNVCMGYFCTERFVLLFTAVIHMHTYLSDELKIMYSRWFYDPQKGALMDFLYSCEKGKCNYVCLYVKCAVFK